ncbi:hypothetical protein [Bradyrhizobium sp. CCBAU 25338]|uniref:hypothetical protein n=1 Tax=Bradyrhizobium sp. CCBAU 25338 TaxID=1641877 RepID=UPI0023030E84|nr:hypothetical protein [Bradyrhizobium sp. CCBAU 25338]MDA9533844.1 hypothetical protein [Bradyrhizobium sp. CCBAU 25338]
MSEENIACEPERAPVRLPTTRKTSKARTLTEIDSSPHSLRRRIQLVDLRRRMGDLHEALRKAKR